MREGGETCLPFSEVGGLVFGGRAIMLFGADWTLATASSLIDVAAEGTGEAPFMLFGLSMLLARKPGSSLVLPVSLGVGIAVLGAITAFLLRHRIASLGKRGMNKLARKWARDREQDLEQTLESLAARRGRFAGACLLHLLAWFGGGVNIWITYRLLGAKIGVLPAMAIESMLSAVLSVGFLIPGGIGVQEAGLRRPGPLVRHARAPVAGPVAAAPRPRHRHRRAVTAELAGPGSAKAAHARLELTAYRQRACYDPGVALYGIPGRAHLTF